MNVYALPGSTESGLSARALEGKSVGVVRDYEYGDEFDLNLRIVRKVVDKNEHGFKMLLSGRIAYMAAEERIAKAPRTCCGLFSAAISWSPCSSQGSS
jgi:polar amino acid transport system substrate-binding protein